MAHGAPQEIDTVIVGNGPSALILSYILHGHIPFYDESSPHPDHILHQKLCRSHSDLLNVDIDSLTGHFAASRFSYSTQALPVNVLLDTLVRPLGETDDGEKKTCVKWHHDPSRAVSHLVLGQTSSAGGQWVDNPVHASWDIGTLSYAGMISLPGYEFDQHYRKRNGGAMPIFLRPSRRAVADYLAAYPDQVGITDSIYNGEKVSGVSRYSNGFYLASHNIRCKNLVLASGIFSELIQPRPLLRPLVHLLDNQPGISPDPLLVIGSGFSAADVIISTPPCQKIIHIYKWAPSASPSPLRACHQQAYPEYAGVYRRMKLSALSCLQPQEKRPKPRHTNSEFDSSRDWKATYEGLPNTEILDVHLTDNGAAIITLQTSRNEPPFQRRVCGLTYVVGRRGSLDYLSPALLQEILPEESRRDVSSVVSGHTLRERVNEDLELAPHVFVIGSLTGDSLIRFAYGGCAYAAGRIMPQASSKAMNGESKEPAANETRKGVRALLRQNSSRFQTPTSSPKIPAMNGLDGHEASPVSLAAERGFPLDRGKE